jgi:hypothetical protein
MYSYFYVVQKKDDIFSFNSSQFSTAEPAHPYASSTVNSGNFVRSMITLLGLFVYIYTFVETHWNGFSFLYLFVLKNVHFQLKLMRFLHIKFINCPQGDHLTLQAIGYFYR